VKKNILVFLDELFYTQDYKEFKSKFVSLNFLQKFENLYKEEFNFYYSFPLYEGDIDNFGSSILNNGNVYPVEGWHNIISFYKKYFKAKKEIRDLVSKLSNNVDIVFIRIPSPAGLILGEEFRKKGKKVIYNVVGDIKDAYHNYKFPLNIPAYFLSYYLYKKELSKNGFFLTVGSKLTNRFKDKNSIFFIDSLITKNDLKDTKKSLSKPIKLLYVGRLLESKGIFLLIDAVKKLREQYEIELTIVGFGKEEKKVEKISKNSNYIKFLGKISNREYLNNIYYQNDIFILPTINSEGFPRVILEAWANGLYVISSKVGGIEGLAKDEENILFFNAGNEKDLVNKILLIIKDNIVRSKLKEGITKVQKKITFEYYSKILYEVLKD